MMIKVKTKNKTGGHTLAFWNHILLLVFVAVDLKFCPTIDNLSIEHQYPYQSEDHLHIPYAGLEARNDGADQEEVREKEK